MRALEDRWPARLAEHPALRDRLLAAYATGRSYHDQRHLREVLDRLEVLLEESLPEDHRDAVVLAAWFHDAVYDSGADPEERSARLAERELARAGVPPPLVAEVARLVRLTAGHQPGPDDEAGKVLCDADLAILAADEPRYDEYVRGVRAEYADLTDDDFGSGRADVLRRLLDRSTLFRTHHGHRHWEEPARRNLERELGTLSH